MPIDPLCAVFVLTPSHLFLSSDPHTNKGGTTLGGCQPDEGLHRLATAPTLHASTFDCAARAIAACSTRDTSAFRHRPQRSRRVGPRQITRPPCHHYHYHIVPPPSRPTTRIPSLTPLAVERVDWLPSCRDCADLCSSSHGRWRGKFDSLSLKGNVSLTM